MTRGEEINKRIKGLYDALGVCDPKLKRGQVWCRKCGATKKVNSGDCFRYGWPKCCGETMTLDNPTEQIKRRETG